MPKADQRYNNIAVTSVEHAHAPIVITSDEIDAQLAHSYERLHATPGLLQSLAGIHERGDVAQRDDVAVELADAFELEQWDVVHQVEASALART